MAIVRSVLACVLASLGCLASAGPVLAWHRTLNYATNDNPQGAAFDSAGNLYVIATKLVYTPDLSTYDLTLTKYSAAGTVLWTRTYDSPNNGFDFPSGLTIDKFNNVWVCGLMGRDENTVSSGLLLKYSSVGALLLTQTYKRYLDGGDNFSKVLTDSAGNVIVAGVSRSPHQGDDILLRKYSATGAILWTYLYSTPGKEKDVPSRLLLDKANDVFFCAQGGSYPAHALIGKVSGATGTSRWLRTQQVTGAVSAVSGASIDSAGSLNVAVSDSKLGVTTLSLIRYATTNGATQMGPKQYVAPTGSSADCVGFERDVANNLLALMTISKYVGQTFVSGIRLVKFNATGVRIWERVVSPTTHQASGGFLTLDSAGSAYFGASLVKGSTYFPRLYRYSSAGAKVWEFSPKRGAPRVEDGRFILRRASGEIFLVGGGKPLPDSTETDSVIFKITGG